MANSKKKVRKYTYRSGFEHKVAKYLEDNKVKFEYETKTLSYTVPKKVKKYKPDFILPNGIICEAKGKFDRLAREKMALVIEQHKDKDIRMLFMRDNYISKTSKTRYSDFCDKRGIKYHISLDGHIPDSWINEGKQSSDDDK